MINLLSTLIGGALAIILVFTFVGLAWALDAYYDRKDIKEWEKNHDQQRTLRMNIITIKNIFTRKESQIQKESVLNYAKMLGYTAYKIKSTNVNGVPDVLLLKNGRAFFIEVKSARGNLTCQQKARMKEIQEQDIYVCAVYSDAEAKLCIDHLERTFFE